MKQRTYMCIDLKSFFASVECVARGLDPFKVNLVVADPERGKGSITLAVSPAMKKLGVASRCRVYEIPDNIDYITASPRMRLYIEKSREIVGIYGRYICDEDILVYSIDECFIDITDYMKIYKTDERGVADLLRNAVFSQTGICATAGIGTNMFLAKVALDILAKHAPDHIGVLDEESFKKELWYHRPITDIWNIGQGTAKRLEKYGVYDLHGIAQLPIDVLRRSFGVYAQTLSERSQGRDNTTVKELREYIPKSKSLSNSQILFCDYNANDARLILTEMIDLLSLDLVRKNYSTDTITLYVGYSRDIVKPLSKSHRLGEHTSSYKILADEFLRLYDNNIQYGKPIRKIGISFGNLSCGCETPLSLLYGTEELEKESRLMKSIVKLQSLYGRNAVVRCRDLQEKATLIARNSMIGGHKA